MHPRGRMIKRLFDIVAAVLGLILTAPLMAILILAIRYESVGSGIFSQDRIGRSGSLFRCRKLRTMVSSAPNVPTHLASASQLTRMGKFLRRTKLDELPQLWNVLKGEMSLVGPRPCLPTQAELIHERQQRGVLVLRPGITGLAQVRGIDMSVPARLAEIDAEYLKRSSFAYDLRILLQTFSTATGFGDKVRD